MTIVKKKLPVIALAVAVIAAICIFCSTNPTANAVNATDIGANIKAPLQVNPEDEADFNITLNGKGSQVNFVINFGDKIEYQEDKFFAAPEDDWDPEKLYELEQIEPGVYTLTAEVFDGTLSIDAAGIYKEEGINTISITGTYFDENGAETEINETFETTVGDVVEEDVEENTEEVVEDTNEDNDQQQEETQSTEPEKKDNTKPVVENDGEQEPSKVTDEVKDQDTVKDQEPVGTGQDKEQLEE